jgi:hypothetical protein
VWLPDHQTVDRSRRHRRRGSPGSLGSPTGTKISASLATAQIGSAISHGAQPYRLAASSGSRLLGAGHRDMQAGKARRRFWNVGAGVMTCVWTVRNGNGEVLSHFTSASRLEVGRKLVPAHYDAFRLQVSSSYRELFERAVKQILRDKHWQIVRRPSEWPNASATADTTGAFQVHRANTIESSVAIAAGLRE